MKNYDEMANSLFERREQYVADKKRKRRVIIRTITPICCISIVVLLVFGIWRSGLFYTPPAKITKDDGVHTGDNENPSNKHSESKDLVDLIGVVKIDGVTYLQFTSYSKKYTMDSCLGDARDFEGTYQTQLNDLDSKLYTTKEDPDVLIVKLGNGGTVTLVREESINEKMKETN